MDKIWTCHKVDGKLKIYDTHGFKRLVEHLPNDGLELILRKEKSKRSANQRKYYFGVMVKHIQDFSGYTTKDETNTAIKDRFNPKPFTAIDGTVKMVGASIEDESVERVEEIFEQIRAYFLIEHNLYIPLPNEVNYE